MCTSSLHASLLRYSILAMLSNLQDKVERSVSAIYSKLRDSNDVVGEGVHLLREKHLHYLKRGIRHLSANFECLDASRPWLCYWILHSMALLDCPIPDDVARDVVGFLSKCQSPTGGFGGDRR